MYETVVFIKIKECRCGCGVLIHDGIPKLTIRCNTRTKAFSQHTSLIQQYIAIVKAEHFDKEEITISRMINLRRR